MQTTSQCTVHRHTVLRHTMLPLSHPHTPWGSRPGGCGLPNFLSRPQTGAAVLAAQQLVPSLILVHLPSCPFLLCAPSTQPPFHTMHGSARVTDIIDEESSTTLRASVPDRRWGKHVTVALCTLGLLAFASVSARRGVVASAMSQLRGAGSNPAPPAKNDRRGRCRHRSCHTRSSRRRQRRRSSQPPRRRPSQPLHIAPTPKPTAAPTFKPTSAPTLKPTTAPTPKPSTPAPSAEGEYKFYSEPSALTQAEDDDYYCTRLTSRRCGQATTNNRSDLNHTHRIDDSVGHVPQQDQRLLVCVLSRFSSFKQLLENVFSSDQPRVI